MRQFLLPDLGEGIQEAEIVTWHVSEGDHVVADQPLVSVETSKAVVEIPSPWSGHIAKLHGAQGDILKAGQKLAEFDDVSSRDRGAIVGEIPDAAADITKTQKPAKIQAVPAARALAAQHGIDLASIKGSGPGGTITVADVKNAGANGAKEIAVRGVRRAMWRNMERSRAEIVPANIMDEVHVDHWAQGTDTTVRLIQAIIAGVQSEPKMNAHFDRGAGELRVFENIDLGIAMDMSDGLFVPILRDAAMRGEADLRIELQRMKQDVTERKISSEELRGQTFTLSNFGMIAGRHVTMVIIPPQVAILGAGRISERPAIKDDEIVPRRVLPLSLTFDHRVIAGGEAARFLLAVMESLQS